MIDTNSQFYITATKMLNDYVAGGGNVNNLGSDDKVYNYIKGVKIKDADGNTVSLEDKFAALGFPRKAKYKNNKAELIAEIEAYRQAGGSFHITRKKLPFYERLHIYSSQLKRKGVELTYEQIMKGLGYRDYSDTYFRCMGIFDFAKYRDKKGFVDSYRKNEKLKAYTTSLARTLNLPYYLVITLVADEKLQKCHIATEYIEYVKSELQKYVEVNGSLKGIKRNDKNLYSKFMIVRKYYGDGVEVNLTANDWLNIFDLGSVENQFREVSRKEIDISPIMLKLKQKCGAKELTAKDVDKKEYYKLLQKSIKLGIPLKELFRNYDINYRGNAVDRLSAMQVSEIPYLDEMKTLRDSILKAKGISAENGYCKEEIFEAKVSACQQAYSKFKDKMFNFTIDETINVEDKELDL